MRGVGRLVQRPEVYREPLIFGLPYCWRRVGMVPNRDFARVETLSQLQRFNRFPGAQMANAFVFRLP